MAANACHVLAPGALPRGGKGAAAHRSKVASRCDWQSGVLQRASHL